MNRTRRRVIQWAGGIPAVFAWGRPARAATEWESAVAGLFVDPKAAAAVGAAYLRPGPAPGLTRVALRAAVTRVLGANALGPVSLEARFRACIRDDFEAGRVVTVGGWMLSQVEAQTCALVHLGFAGDV